MIVFGMISSLIALLIMAIHTLTSDNIRPSVMWVCVMIVYLGVFSVIAGVSRKKIEKKVTIEYLKGNNPYKMEIRFELKDSIYIPIDTVYIKL